MAVAENTLDESGYVTLNRNEIAASALGVSPRGIAAFESLQNAAYSTGPASSAAAQAAADQAAVSADTAAQSAATAQTVGEGAQARADAAYALAGTKVSQDVGPSFAAPTGTVSRAAYTVYTAPVAATAYDPAQMQALMNAVASLSQTVAAIVTDLRANGALTG